MRKQAIKNIVKGKSRTTTAAENMIENMIAQTQNENFLLDNDDKDDDMIAKNIADMLYDSNGVVDETKQPVFFYTEDSVDIEESVHEEAYEDPMEKLAKMFNVRYSTEENFFRESISIDSKILRESLKHDGTTGKMFRESKYHEIKRFVIKRFFKELVRKVV